MKAAYIMATGGPEAIAVGDLPTPVPGPREALVRVGAVSLNPIDLYMRSGIVATIKSFPYVIGCDVAGTVEALGPDVSRFKVGDRVWGSNQGLLGRQGVASEYAAIHEDWLYPTPAAVSDEDAASMALVGITAHLGLFQVGRLSSGDTVYVPGGSGGVGSMVIQMAKAAGSRVATSAGSPERVEYCRSIGADLAMNYKSDDIPARLKEFSPDGIHLWYETQREPSLEAIIPQIRVGGRMIVMAGRTARPVLPLGMFYTRNCSLHGFAMFNFSAADQRGCAEAINLWTGGGKVLANVGKVFSLAEAAQAQKLLEDNTIRGEGTLRGKVVIRVS